MNILNIGLNNSKIKKKTFFLLFRHCLFSWEKGVRGITSEGTNYDLCTKRFTNIFYKLKYKKKKERNVYLHKKGIKSD